MNHWTKDKELELIEAWKGCPPLFNINTRSYSDRNFKTKLHKQIAEEIGTTG